MPTAPSTDRPGRRVPPSTARRAGQAVLLTVATLAAVTIAKLWVFDAFGTAPAFLLYVAAIIVGTRTGGWPGGLATTAASAALGLYYFHAPIHSFRLEGAVDVMRLVTFFVEGSLVTAITWRGNVARARAATAVGEAQDSVAQLEGVLRGVADGVSMQAADGRLVFANAAGARIAGFETPLALTTAPLEEVTRRLEVLAADGTPLPAEELPGRLALAGRAAPERLVRLRLRATGQERWVQLRASAVRLGDSDALHAVNVFQDVTEARQRDEALRESRELLSTTLSSIGDAVIATDARGCVTFMNPVAEALTGWASAAAAGKPLTEVFRIFNEDTRAPVESPVERVLRDGQTVGLANHTILVARDGRDIAIDDSAAPIRHAGGGVAGTVLVFRDVSHKRAEERRRQLATRAAAELGASLDYERALVTMVSLAVPAIADWCAIDMVDAGRLRRLAVQHVDPEKIRVVYEIERLYPEDPSSGRGAYTVMRSGGPTFVPEIPAGAIAATAKDATHLALLEALRLRSYIAVPLRDGAATIGVLSLAMAESGRTYTTEDLALATALADRAALAVAHARLFEAATRARDEAERANRAKDEFLAMLGHELRNPLAPILTALQLMKRRAPNLLERERGVLERQVRYMVTLVDDLLDVSRIARGKIDLAREPVDLADTIARALEMAAPQIDERRQIVEKQVAEGTLVTGDPVRLAQAVANLLTNASKYTEPGGHITVSVAREGAELVVRVRDTGVGIAPELLPRVFDLFVQGDQPLDRAKGGLGLGLAIVRSVVELHGGRVSAASDGVGRGSTFELRLPARVADADAVPSSDEAPGVHGGRGVDVLIVDDNVDALELLAETLGLMGYRPRTATNADEALARAAELRPAVALLDLGLPVIDGYELARRLRALAPGDALKLVAVTGYGQAADRERTRAAGFDAHLVKPVSIDDLERVIAHLVAAG